MYAQETTDGKVSAYEYIVDADDYRYMGLRVSSKDFDKSEALLDASYKYLEGIDDGGLVFKAQFEVTGTIKKMPNASLSLYYEYLDEAGVTETERDVFLPYYLEVGDNGGNSNISLILLVGFGLIFIIIALILLIRAVTGKCQKPINTYIAASGNPEAATQRVESFLATAPAIHKLQYDQNFICGQNGVATIFGETPKLVWAYKYTVNNKQLFITVSKSHSVMIAFTDGSRYVYPVKKEAHAEEILAVLSQIAPKAIIGYNDQLEKMFRKDMNGFLNLKYNLPQEVYATKDDATE